MFCFGTEIGTENRGFSLVFRAVRYDDIYRMDEIKSLSFHILLYRLFRGVANTLFTVLFHHLDDCDLYTPPRSVKGRQKQVENDQN